MARMFSVIAAAAILLTGCGGAVGQSLGSEERSEVVVPIDKVPQAVVDGARKELITINKVEQVTLRDGNMRYEFKGKNRVNRTVVLKVDPEGGILAVQE